MKIRWKGEGRDRLLLGLGCLSSLLILVGLLGLIVSRRANSRDSRNKVPFNRILPTLMLAKVVADVCLNVSWLMQVLLMDEETCEGAQGRFWAFTTQFFLVGSEFLYGFFCVDLLVTMADPFLHSGTNIRNYIVATVLLVLGSCFVLISKEDFYGETFIPVCYTNTKNSASGANLLNLAFFYAPFLVCYSLSIITVVHASVVLGTPLAGFDNKARAKVLRELRMHVFVHGFLWGAVLVVYIPIVILVDAPTHTITDDNILKVLFSIFVFMVGIRPGIDMLPFCFRLYYDNMHALARKDDVLTPMLSKELQRDVLHYVLQGTIGLLEGKGEPIELSQDQLFITISNPYIPIETIVSVPEMDLDEGRDDNADRGSPLDTPLLSNSIGLDMLRFAGEIGRRREARLTVISISPLIFAGIVSVLTAWALGYDRTITLVSTSGIVFAIVGVVLVWFVSLYYLKKRYIAVGSEYCPDLFHRARLGIDGGTEGLLVSLKNSCNTSKTQFKLSGGRSGAFMFVTLDKKFIIKTITETEKDVLLEILGDLVAHWEQQPGSSLVRLYGLFSLNSFGRKFYLIIMENIIPSRVDAQYDLKGSWIDRTAAQPKSGNMYYCKHCSKPYLHGDAVGCRLNRVHEPIRLLKDNDFMSAKVLFSLEFARIYREQLARDVEFLHEHHLMDYSLLLGIRYRLAQQLTMSDGSDTVPSMVRIPGTTADLRSGVGFPAFLLKGPAFYHIGIIDYLQKYSFDKRAEHVIKKYCLRKNDIDQDGFPGLSAVEPKLYAARFLKRVVEDVIVELNNIVQLVRYPDLAPIATIDVSQVLDFDNFKDIVKAVHPRAKELYFDLIDHDEEDDPDYLAVPPGKVLNQQSFEQFRSKCAIEELTLVMIISDHK